jgi:hypothetical protein
MSEEKPTFKVTDRRLFNPDGTPRDIAREEEAPAPETPATAPPVAAEQTQTESAPAEPARQAASSESASAGKRGARETPTPSERERAADETPEGSQSFFMLVEFLASFAADALGMVNHPGGGGGVNLQLAHQCIDMLGSLKEKTRGNLNEEEQQFLDMILSQLRMQYVSLTSAPRPPQGGRGFTGGDITGGR